MKNLAKKTIRGSDEYSQTFIGCKDTTSPIPYPISKLPSNDYTNLKVKTVKLIDSIKKHDSLLTVMEDAESLAEAFCLLGYNGINAYLGGGFEKLKDTSLNQDYGRVSNKALLKTFNEVGKSFINSYKSAIAYMRQNEDQHQKKEYENLDYEDPYDGFSEIDLNSESSDLSDYN